MEDTTEAERLFDEVRDLNSRVEALEKANRDLNRENEDLKQELSQGAGVGQRSSLSTGKGNEWGSEAKPVVDDDHVQKARYRLLWQNAIRAVIISHGKAKLIMSREHALVLQVRLDKGAKEINSLKLSFIESKKMREAESRQLGEKKEKIKELTQKLEMETKNKEKEKEELEEDFTAQLKALRATSQGLVEQGNFESTLPATHEFGDDAGDAVELRERVEELEQLLEAAGEEEQGLIATKEALMERVADLEDQLQEVGGSVHSEGAAALGDDDLRDHLLMLERELAMTQKAEREWREKATMSWWSRFNDALCVNPERQMPRDEPTSPDGPDARVSLLGRQLSEGRGSRV